MIEKIANDLEKLDGNFIKNHSIYISQKNIKRLIEYINADVTKFSLLITPYLINEKNGAIYELMYYEQNIEILDNGETTLFNYNINNTLPKEITDNFYPSIKVNKSDYKILIDYLDNYFSKMSTFSFKEERESSVSLQQANLYYQLF